jgi:DNA-binding response OmpR family regulator
LTPFASAGRDGKISAVTPANSEASALKDRRILIAEDGFALANIMETVLSTLGCQVVGPIARVSEGLRLARAAGLDGALLDVSLDGEEAYAIADTLLGRAVPVILVTGRRPEELPTRFRELPRVDKPFAMPALIRLCTQTFARAR